MDRRKTGDREVAPTVHCSGDVPIAERTRHSRRWGHRRYSLAASVFALSLEALIPSAIARNDMPAPWAVEQMPGGTVSMHEDSLEIRDKGGCAVWYTRELRAPETVSYDAMVVDRGKLGERTSDLNCFWMAADPACLGSFFSLRPRSGKFTDYDSLRTYYVGFGGNDNTTTRFRRYAGDGTATYRVDGSTLFSYRDKHFLSRGWFGFRTVDSHIRIKNFVVRENAKP